MSADPPLEAMLHLRKGAAARVGADRIRLLAAIAGHGSISAAGREAGLSYKAAWDAVQALNNLFERPLVEAAPGGKAGGGARVTPAGQAVLASFARIEQALALAAEHISAALDQGDLDPLAAWSFGMKTSARNALRGVVTAITPGAVNAEVTLKVAEGLDIVSVITRESAEDLALAPGRAALALIKSSFVILAVGEAPPRTSARNCLAGVVTRHEAGAVNDEVVLELAAGKTLTAVVTRESAEALGIAEGVRAWALVKAPHVILAVD